MTKESITAALLSAVILLLGCTGAPKPNIAAKVDVAGSVQFDGKPMSEAEGEISFSIVGQAPVILPIKNGKFEGKGPVGDARVEVRAWRKGEPVMMDGKPVGDPVRENYIPAKFNTESTMTAKIGASGAKDLKFEVESK